MLLRNIHLPLNYYHENTFSVDRIWQLFPIMSLQCISDVEAAGAD